jgi:hypothetical protein
MRRSVAAMVGATALVGALGVSAWVATAVERKENPLCNVLPVCSLVGGSGSIHFTPSAAQKLAAREIKASPVAPATALKDREEPGFRLGVDSGTVNLTLTDGLVAMRGGLELRDASGRYVSFSDPQADLTARKTSFLMKTAQNTAGTRVRVLDFSISSVDALSKPGTLQVTGVVSKLTPKVAKEINNTFGGKALFAAGDEFLIGSFALGLAVQ